MTSIQILALSSTDAREWARHATDRDLLVEVRDAAQADTEKPRRSLLAAIEYRLAKLATAALVDDEPVARDDAPAEPHMAPVEDHKADAQAHKVKEAADADLATCALAFVRALTSGDVALVASMIDDVRRNTYGRDALASALVAAHVEARPVTVARAPKAERAPRGPALTPATSTPIAERFALAVSLGTTAEDGAIILDRDAMTRAGFPASWHTASLWHVSYGSARQAARRHGFEGEFRSGTLTLRPVG